MNSVIDIVEGGETGMPGIVFTNAAARKVQELILEERNFELKLRVYISSMGSRLTRNRPKTISRSITMV